ncbi:hypothetical protein Cyrtocomes_01129 [Candidatus Cyrtobacter comes]|uniref:Uncharacterized protein n=1 Tax=Candidatus Cyrtobacter comes TaxID=675776 RepID=A0ABU5L9E1_9RICK|nr:hypothetical protein [Candidatus Cyrtobacter comes]
MKKIKNTENADLLLVAIPAHAPLYESEWNYLEENLKKWI